MDLTNEVFRTGNFTSHKVTTKDATFSKLRDVIGARMAEYVYLDSEGKTALMVDEEGLLEEKPVNLAATQLVGSPIVGDAMIVNLSDLDDIPYE